MLSILAIIGFDRIGYAKGMPLGQSLIVRKE